MILSPFEHKFIRVFQNHFGSTPRSFFLAVSGGVDSMVLLNLFYKFQNQIQSSFRVCYVHHGISKDLELEEFRNKGLAQVKAFCSQNKLEFVTNVEYAQDELKSESDLREWRYQQFYKLKKDSEILTLAHHLDDLLETQLMDLIRGSHFEQWANFKEYSGYTFRPLAFASKDEIYDFAKKNTLNWLEDPSNVDGKGLRNWLRNGFLSELNQRSKGLKENLMKNLVKLYEYQVSSEEIPEIEVSMSTWMKWTEAEKKQFILKTALRLGLKSMTQGQILDTLKKLDLGQKEIKFQTGPIFWTKTADRLYAYREIP